MHPRAVLLEVVGAGPDFRLGEALRGLADVCLVVGDGGVREDRVDALTVPLEVVASAESFYAAFATRDIASMWLFVPQCVFAVLPFSWLCLLRKFTYCRSDLFLKTGFGRTVGFVSHSWQFHGGPSADSREGMSGGISSGTG